MCLFLRWWRLPCGSVESSNWCRNSESLWSWRRKLLFNPWWGWGTFASYQSFRVRASGKIAEPGRPDGRLGGDFAPVFMWGSGLCCRGDSCSPRPRPGQAPSIVLYGYQCLPGLVETLLSLLLPDPVTHLCPQKEEDKGCGFLVVSLL